MTEQELHQTREFQAARALEDALNTMSWKPEVFAKSIRFYHRTLQQELFRTLIAVIIEMAKDDFMTDPRNQASHDTAKAIVESGILDEAYLPFI